MNFNLKCQKYKVYANLSFVFAYIVWMIVYSYFDSISYTTSGVVFAFSWVGIIVCISYLMMWKKLAGKILIPFNFFLAFLALFNFGQCFLWAFGIHSDREIGKKLLFHSVLADDLLIVKAQLLFIITYIAINTGAIFVWSYKNTKKIVPLTERDLNSDNRYQKLFITSIIISIYSIPCALYQAAIRLIYSQIYSYHDLYYGAISSTVNNTIITIGANWFFASLLGLLIGSGYKRKVVNFVYIVFAIYAILSLLCGDRGEWVKSLIFFFWTHITLYKSKSIKINKLIKWIAIGFVGLCTMDAIVGMRNTGLSLDGFVESITDPDNNPIISNFIEFGQSMGVCMIVIKNSLSPMYGNTFLMSIPTLFGTGLANRLFGINYIQLHTWFPAQYLKISYGTDFSIIGEAVLNFGIFVSPFILLIEGIIIGSVYSIPNRRNNHPLALCLSISCMNSILRIVRSTVWLTLNEIVFVIVIFVFVYSIVAGVQNNKRKRV